MLNLIRKIIKPKYKTLNQIEINSKNILHNLEYIQSLQEQAEIFPVLKSNAYGHGLKEICHILKKTNIKMVAVDSFPEAQVVYKYFPGKVLILGEMPLKAYSYCKLKRTEFIVYNKETLKYLSRYGKKAKIHLFFNSGMNREGIDDLDFFIDDNKKYLNKVEISGFCSHLAEADDNSSSFNQEQEKRFTDALETLHRSKIYPKWIHLGNSAGVFVLNNKIFNAFRPGIAFYGYNPFLKEDKNFSKASFLRPALSLYSTIIAKHKVKKGSKVSYSNSFVAEDDCNIAVIPFGYFEGLDRRFSGCIKFLFNKNKDKNEIFWVKIAGNVCMNLCCINFLNKDFNVGDRVQIFSDNNDMDNSIQNLSNKINIISYELLSGLNHSIKRKII
ncbi:MAG: alanine racemase [Patescibacteria group bacterium]|nr:alanine racemase [Patescibacteria group bacterium]